MAQTFGGQQQMPRERVSADLRRVTVTPVACIAGCPVLKQDVTEFVRKRAALPHGIPGTRDTDVHDPAGWIPHSQTMLVRADVKHRHVDPGRLFDKTVAGVAWLAR